MSSEQAFVRVPAPRDPSLVDLLHRALADPGSGLERLTTEELLRLVPGRRATLRGRLDERRVVVKVFSSPRARGNDRRLRALAAAGVADVVPASLAVAGDGHVGVLSWTAGEPLDTVDDTTYVRACGEAGAALARVHGSAAPLDRAWRHADEVAQLLRRAPDSVRAAAAVEASRPVAVTALVPSHRDLHPRQVVVAGPAGPRLALIDLDDAALAPAALDVGNMLAHLLREEVVGRRSGPVTSAATEAFLAGYGDEPADLEVWRRLSLVRLAGLAESRHGKPEERDALLALLADTRSVPAGTPTGGTRVHADRPVRLEAVGGSAVVVKTYLRADGAAVHEAMERLWRSPFGGSRSPAPGLPRPLGFDARTGDLSMEYVEGAPLAARGSLGSAVSHATDCAALLADLHASGVRVGRTRTRSRLLRSCARKVAEVEHETDRTRLEAVLARVERSWGGAAGDSETLVLSHGDFSPRNVLESPDGLVLIDFDRLQMASPLRDVAYWAAWLWVTSTLDEGSREDAWRTGHEFAACYTRLTGVQARGTDWDCHRALALVRIAHGWSSLAEDPVARRRVIGEAEAMMGD